MNDGTGAYTPGANVPIGAPFDVHAADINGDDKLDIFVANSYGQQLAVSLGNGDGTFRMPIAQPPRQRQRRRRGRLRPRWGPRCRRRRCAGRCGAHQRRLGRLLRPHGLLPPRDLARFARRRRRRLQRGSRPDFAPHRVLRATARRLPEQWRRHVRQSRSLCEPRPGRLASHPRRGLHRRRPSRLRGGVRVLAGARALSRQWRRHVSRTRRPSILSSTGPPARHRRLRPRRGPRPRGHEGRRRRRDHSPQQRRRHLRGARRSSCTATPAMSPSATSTPTDCPTSSPAMRPARGSSASP